MHVSYENTRADSLALSLYLMPRQRAIRPMAVGLLVVMLISWLRDPPHKANALGIAVLVVFTFVCWLIAMPVIMISVILLTTALSRNKAFLCSHTIRLTPDCLLDESSTVRAEVKWAGFHKIVETKKYLFILTSEEAGRVVPRRAFASQGEWEAFCNYCLDTFNSHAHGG